MKRNCPSEAPQHQGHPRFYELVEEMIDLHNRKNANYAKDSNPLSNFEECESFGVPAHIGAMVRMSDKWSRLVQLMGGKKDMVGEPMKDTLRDFAVYCLLEIILLERYEKQEKA